MDDSAGKYCKHIPVLAHFRMLRSPLLCGLSPFDHRGTGTKQPGGRKPPVPWVPWTPRIPGRNSSTDPTPQQMPRPDPPTPRLTRRRPCAALQRLIAHGQLVMKICEGKIWTISELCLEYLHIKGIQGLEWLERKMNVESWQGSSFKPATYSRYHRRNRRNTMKFRYLHHRALSPLEALTCIWQLFVIASLSLEALARLKDKVHHAHPN